MRKCFNKFEKILKTLRQFSLKFKKLFRKTEKILLIFKFFRKYVTFRINMKYYCVLNKIVNFENFIDTFDRLLRKFWKFWKFLIKFVKI